MLKMRDIRVVIAGVLFDLAFKVDDITIYNRFEQMAPDMEYDYCPDCQGKFDEPWYCR